MIHQEAHLIPFRKSTSFQLCQFSSKVHLTDWMFSTTSSSQQPSPLSHLQSSVLFSLIKIRCNTFWPASLQNQLTYRSNSEIIKVLLYSFVLIDNQSNTISCSQHSVCKPNISTLLCFFSTCFFISKTDRVQVHFNHCFPKSNRSPKL